MAKKSLQSSLKSCSASTFSWKATSVKNAVKKGAEVITRPFKKVKKAISTRSRSSSTNDSDKHLDNYDEDLDNQFTMNSQAASNADASELEIETEVDPETELGKFIVHI